jgi:hypothetical protein
VKYASAALLLEIALVVMAAAAAISHYLRKLQQN